MKPTLFTILLFLSLVNFSVFAQEGIPDKPSKERLVTDLADVLTEQEEQQLEAKLVTYWRESSTQVAVVTVKSLNGYERADFATRLAQKWGIGSAKHDNGILLLVKPKYPNSKGQVFIATGYGLEGKTTDLASGQIRTNILIPHFKQNDYFGGIDKGTDALIALTKGEYNDATSENQPTQIPIVWIILFVILLLFFLSLMKRKAKGQYQMSRKGGSVPMWILLEELTRERGRGDFDDFNSGSGGFGGFGGGFGGSGGFGGFGGGSFGGGGAGGSW
ncbi:MAG: hypothetical protein CSB03_00230 [Bacteroidia bacterium]|nr:MAG: hypothetical protein CSB03_00230 [Bacteroidia bacterium]